MNGKTRFIYLNRCEIMAIGYTNLLSGRILLYLIICSYERFAVVLEDRTQKNFVIQNLLGNCYFI